MDNLKEEVKLYYADQTDMLGNLLYDLWLRHDDALTKDLWPQLLGCTDMGWQQKGSGCKRNSQSGHTFIIAMKTRKVIAKALCRKDCGYCKLCSSFYHDSLVSTTVGTKWLVSTIST